MKDKRRQEAEQRWVASAEELLGSNRGGLECTNVGALTEQKEGGLGHATAH